MTCVTGSSTVRAGASGRSRRTATSISSPRTARGRRSPPPGSTSTPARSSSMAGPCSSVRSRTFGSAFRSPRPARCNAMARPALRKVTRPAAAGRARLVPFDLDRSLVDAARAEPARFDALYRKYVAQVYNFAIYELGDHHEAEDATERTFLSALAALPRFRERATRDDGEGASTFRIWLFRIARNVVAERRRRARRRPEAPLEAALDATAPGDVERTVVERESVASAWRAIDRLSGDRRRAIVLRFVHEMSTGEIAEI